MLTIFSFRENFHNFAPEISEMDSERNKQVRTTIAMLPSNNYTSFSQMCVAKRQRHAFEPLVTK